LDETEKRVKRENKLYVIECLNLFRKDIKPAWEDPLNKLGYELRVELEVLPDKRELTEVTFKQVWQDLVFGLIGEECVYSHLINGIRYKSQPSRNTIRVEIWVKAKPPRDKEVPSPNDKFAGNLESLSDDRLKEYWGIRLWLEDTIKTAKKTTNSILVSFTGHQDKSK